MREYFAVTAENTGKMSRILRELFPEELSGLSEEELYGVGQLRGLPITTPVIEIAERTGGPPPRASGTFRARIMA